MKFLIDAQLPRRLATQLQKTGLDATHTLELPDGNRTTDQALIILSITNQAVLWRRIQISCSRSCWRRNLGNWSWYQQETLGM